MSTPAAPSAPGQSEPPADLAGPERLAVDTGATATAPRRVSVWNVANGLTALRLLLVPVFAVLLWHDHGADVAWRWAALAAFSVAIVTDRLDGELARRRGLVTDVGKIADPIADKALIGAALIALSALGELSWWVTSVILAREAGVTLLRLWVIRRGVIAASVGGKAKTLAQALAIGGYILVLHGWPATLRAWLMGAAVALTVLTGADYALRALRLRRAVPSSAESRGDLSNSAGTSPTGQVR